jgi:SAM-dependent methyltransferase
MADAIDWDERYRADGYLFGTEPNEYLQRHARVWRRGSRILSIADGEGRNSVWLARQGLVVDAFDPSRVAVEKAQRLAVAAGVAVNFTVADVEGWSWRKASHDGIAAIFVQFAGPALRARLFARLIEALKPGGTLILAGYTPRQLAHGTGGPKDLDLLYTSDLLRGAFAPLEIVELVEYEAELAEGTRHVGRSALVGMVARKAPQPG